MNRLENFVLKSAMELAYEEYLQKDVPGMNEDEIWMHYFSPTWGRFDEFLKKLRGSDTKGAEPVVSLQQIKVAWHSYYYSKNRYKKDINKVFDDFLKNRKQELDALGIYSFADYQRLIHE